MRAGFLARRCFRTHISRPWTWPTRRRRDFRGNKDGRRARALCCRPGTGRPRGARFLKLTASQLKDWLVGTWDALADLLRAPTAVLRDCAA